MTPRVTQAHEDARRRAILEGAYRCFSRRGLRRTTMKDVAEEAGLSAGALYRYFDGKEVLLAALAEEAAKRRRETLSELEVGSESLASVVARLLPKLAPAEATVSVRLDVRLWAEALDDENVAAAVRAALRSVREPVAAHVQKAQEDDQISKALDPDALGRVVISLLVGLELQYAHDHDLDPESYGVAVRELLTCLERAQ